MDCATAREAISANLDAEDPGVDPAELDAHVAACVACAMWSERAADVTRFARLAPATDLPDITDRALAGFRPSRRAQWRTWLRWAVAVAALCQLGVVAGQFLSANPTHGTGHLLHETAAFNVAVGVALLWVAARPGRARSQRPLLLTVSGALVLLSMADLVQGHVSWDRLGTHLPLLVGALLTVLLGTLERGAPWPDSRGEGPRRWFGRSLPEAERGQRPQRSREQYQPPAARKAA
ncbi:zf-HC2 domain-containing protein [Prauserella cavernicola]|uniref:Zf-HC2 domain-containing protein n=1 Tax=Prauserella cavernicola TaxID=2800127 RepID=A0A934QS30_9PSEU|nr:zf-HC2 domain-containing protein [Prauserella cavernicola]MBK1785646.1 zf-HC2 domain-containing protein [Prauserella cavernicola]